MCALFLASLFWSFLCLPVTLRTVFGLFFFGLFYVRVLPPAVTLQPPSVTHQPPRLPTNRHWLPTNRHRRAYWTLRVFFSDSGTPCVRVVDKGAGGMWGVCSDCVWGKMEEFMISENFARTNWTQREWEQNTAKVVKDMKLQRSERGRLCWLKESHFGQGTGSSREFQHPQPPSSTSSNSALPHSHSHACCGCCRLTAHTIFSAQTSGRHHDGFNL